MRRKPTIHCIYVIRNLIDNKVYIGQTTHFEARCREHKRDLIENKHRCKHLQYAWNKDGKESFVFEILELLLVNKMNTEEIRTSLENSERSHMLHYKCGNHEFSYNSMTPMKSSYGSKIKTPSIHSKPILQYDEKGNFIKEWESLRSAGTELNITPSGIGACCKMKLHVLKGYIFRYKTSDDYPLKITPTLEHNKEILQYNKHGEFIREWESIRQVAYNFGDSNHALTNITGSCNNKVPTAYESIWRFKTEDYPLKIKGIYKIKPEKSKLKHKGRAVDQFDMDWNFIKRWDRIKDAQEALGFSRSSINSYFTCALTHCKGFKWKYVQEST